MNTNEFEYYFIESSGIADVPLLRNDDDIDPDALDFLLKKEYANIEKPVQLCFNSPIPKNPRMVDYHSLPDTVFSEKIYDVLSPMNIEGVQFVPAIINGKDGESYENYWVVNAYTRIECFDKEKSIYEVRRNRWKKIEKVYLDKNLLSEIPVNKRLIFKPIETGRFELYHKSIVDAIMAVNSEGIRFVKVEDWFEGVAFV